MRKLYKRKRIDKQKGLKIILLFLVFIVSFILIDYEKPKPSKSPSLKKTKNKEIKKPVYEYGIQLDSFEVFKKTVENGENIASIWANYNMFFLKDEILQRSTNIFDFEKN